MEIKKNGIFNTTSPLTNFEIQSIIRMNQDLMEFFQEIIRLKR